MRFGNLWHIALNMKEEASEWEMKKRGEEEEEKVKCGPAKGSTKWNKGRDQKVLVTIVSCVLCDISRVTRITVYKWVRVSAMSQWNVTGPCLTLRLTWPTRDSASAVLYYLTEHAVVVVNEGRKNGNLINLRPMCFNCCIFILSLSLSLLYILALYFIWHTLSHCNLTHHWCSHDREKKAPMNSTVNSQTSTGQSSEVEERERERERESETGTRKIRLRGFHLHNTDTHTHTRT